MPLAKFSAKIAYTSDEGCEYQTHFKQNPSTPDANKVLLDTVEHLAWMGAVGGQVKEVEEAFKRGHAQGVERRAHLDSSKEGQ